MANSMKDSEGDTWILPPDLKTEGEFISHKL